MYEYVRVVVICKIIFKRYFFFAKLKINERSTHSEY